MDRNTIVGLSLIFLILVGYYWWTSPSEAQLAREQKIKDSIALVEKNRKAPAASTAKDSVVKTAAETPDSSALAKSIGGFAKNAEGTAKIIELKNKSLTVKLTTKGGRISSVKLNEYKRSDSTELIMFDEKHSSFYY